MHRALVVEDHARTARDLAEILDAMECEATIVGNKEDALTFLDKQQPCVILLDLSIPLTKRGLKGRPAIGIALLQEIRRRFGSPREARVWIPILVISGHAREPDQAVEIMKLDADDVIQKPYDEDDVVRRVGEALRKSGRATHEVCGTKAIGKVSDRAVGIPGTTVKGRPVVMIGQKKVQLTDESLAALLRLLIAHTKGRSLPLADFGRDDQNAYKVVDRLRTALRGAVDDPTAFVVNSRGGLYSLASDVSLGSVDTSWLASWGNATIADLARELGLQRP